MERLEPKIKIIEKSKKEKKEKQEPLEVEEVKFEELGEGDRLDMKTKVGLYKIKVIEEPEEEKDYLFVRFIDNEEVKYEGKTFGTCEMSKLKESAKDKILDAMHIHIKKSRKVSPKVIKSGEGNCLYLEDLKEIGGKQKIFVFLTPSIEKILWTKKKKIGQKRTK